MLAFFQGREYTQNVRKFTEGSGTGNFRVNLLKGMVTMTDTRYGKPCLTNLPTELFKDIATEIINSPKPNYSKMNAECDILRFR